MSSIDYASYISDSSDTALPIDGSASSKRRILVMLLGYFGLLGVICTFLPEDNRVLDFVVRLPVLVLAVTWCHVDAYQRKHAIGTFMRHSLILIFFIAFPIYIFQTRGLAGFKTLALAGLLVVAMFACLCATGLLTLSIGDLAGVVEL